MNARIQKLEALLGLVHRRTAEPRVLRASVAAIELSGTAEPVLDEPGLDEPGLDEMASSAPLLDEPVFSAPVLDEPSVESAVLDEPLIDTSAFDGPSAFAEEGETPGFDEGPEPKSGAIASGSLDQAMSEAEHQPPITPPPESGEEVARPQLPRDAGPTMEQLGQTIQLDESGSDDFELDEPVLESEYIEESTVQLNPEQVEALKNQALGLRSESSAPQSEGLEVKLPSALSAPAGDEVLRVPDNAREELERLALGEATPIEALVSKRPVLSTNTVELVNASRSFEPKSFLELLDASLSLR